MTNKLLLKDTVALVTGANRGIGKDIVAELLESGTSKVFAGVRKENSISDLVKKYGDQVEEIKLDVTSQKDIDAAALKIKKLNVLINNAGVFSMGNFTNENALQTLDLNWNVNVRGLVAVTQAFFKLISASDNGAIVSLASIAGLGNMSFMATYSASKSAVHSLMQGIRSELKESNILVSTVYPGPVDTEMTAGFDVAKASSASVAKNIISGMQQGLEEIFPDEMSANMGAMYLSSPKELEKHFSSF